MYRTDSGEKSINLHNVSNLKTEKFSIELFANYIVNATQMFCFEVFKVVYNIEMSGA